jgi:hypothetical protein
VSGWRKRQVVDKQIKAECNNLLKALVGEAMMDPWWLSPNKAFDGRRPVDTNIDLVYSYLLNNAFGGEYL